VSTAASIPRTCRAVDPRRVLATGGGGFTMGERTPALDLHVLELTGRRMPKICFLPTASGDEREQVRRFHERYRTWPCEPSTLSLFHLRHERVDPAAHLLAQDAIYIGGGSMRNMLAIWREHGIEGALRAAWQAGIVLAGLSAGAMCWFEGGISLSGGAPEPLRGLGFLPGSLSVHRDGEPERLPVYRQAISRGELPDGYAADDGAGLVYAGTSLLECVASQPGAGVSRVSRGGDGVVETSMPVRRLGRPIESGSGCEDLNGERFAVSELRELRAGRSRWR
jgi:dipeptidase E